MADRLKGLDDERRALLVAELARRRTQLAAATVIGPRPPGTEPELSFSQQRLWLLDRMAPGRATYNATMTMQLTGPLDRELLHRTLDEVVERHEALRTVGVEQDGMPRGRLLQTGVRWREHDAGDDAELRTALLADAAEPFDLTRDVMLRAHLYRVAADRHVLILVTHHIATDGWSRDLLFAEVTELYNARSEGRPPRVEPLPLQYGDYARWQHQQVDRGLTARNEQFWRTELDGAQFVLELPTDFPREAVPAHDGVRIAATAREGSGDALRALGRTERATYFMTMLAVGGTLLHCITGQDDIVLGGPVANRQRPELERLIGFFANTVAFRVRLGGNPSFRELIRRCRQTVIECLAHQDVPFDRVVELVNPVRATGRNPLFQVNFRMQGAAPPPPQLRGLTVTRMLTETGASRFDLALGFVDRPGAVAGYLEYSSLLFRPATAAAWRDALLRLVDRVTADPDQRLDTLAPLVRGDIEQAVDGALSSRAPARSIRRPR